MFLLLDHPWVYLKMGYCYSSQLSWTVSDGLPHPCSLHNTFLPPWELSRRKETVFSVSTGLVFNVSVLPSRSGRQLRATEIACIVLGGLWGNQQLKGRYFIPGYRLFIWQPVASTLNHIIFFSWIIDTWCYLPVSTNTWHFSSFSYTINKNDFLLSYLWWYLVYSSSYS